MGYVEIFRLDNQGAGWVDLSEATPQELLDLEIGLFTDLRQFNPYFCRF